MNQTPKYCGGCGRKLKPEKFATYDTQTGERISESLLYLRCSGGWWEDFGCGTRYYLRDGGTWEMA